MRFEVIPVLKKFEHFEEDKFQHYAMVAIENFNRMRKQARSVAPGGVNINFALKDRKFMVKDVIVVDSKVYADDVFVDGESIISKSGCN